MAETSGGKGREKKKKGTKKIELTIRDLKFIKAVDRILEDNKKNGVKPDNDNNLGARIYPSNRSIITAVRSGIRHIPDGALTALGELYNIDMNFFYRDAPFQYKPEKYKATTHNEVGEKGILNTGENATITQIQGDVKGEVVRIVKGNVYKGNKVGEIIQKADKIINNKFEADQKKVCKELITSIKQETESMENRILQQNEDIKKMANIYEKQLRSKKQRIKGLEDELANARETQTDLLTKYSKLLEQLAEIRK